MYFLPKFWRIEVSIWTQDWTVFVSTSSIGRGKFCSVIYVRLKPENRSLFNLMTGEAVRFCFWVWNDQRLYT